MKPVVVGCRTIDFPQEQLEAFKKHQPFGMIIFAEPFKEGPATVKHVVQQFKSVCPHGIVFIDMEGGRVNRMKPEFNHGWRDIPSSRTMGELAKTDLAKAKEAIYLNAQLIADSMQEYGITVNNAPVVDLVSEDVMAQKTDDGKPHATSASLYNRSFSHDPVVVAECARAYADGLHSLGVTSVLKHLPGYGRAAIDPHYGAEQIDASAAEMEATDLVPYKILQDYPAAMTAHTIYPGIDAGVPGTLSKKVIDFAREKAGFKGVIITDTIEMNSALPGGFSTTERDQFGMGLPLPGTLKKITEQSLVAGCDLVLHSDCSRNFQHTLEILETAPELDGAKAKWLLDKMTMTRTVSNFDRATAEKRLQQLLAGPLSAAA